MIISGETSTVGISSVSKEYLKMLSEESERDDDDGGCDFMRGRITFEEKIHGCFMLFVAVGIAFSVLIMAWSLLSTESVKVSLESGGTAYIERTSFLGAYSKNYLSRVRKGEWESKLVAERVFWKLTAVNDQPWKRMYFIDSPGIDGEEQN